MYDIVGRILNVLTGNLLLVAVVAAFWTLIRRSPRVEFVARRRLRRKEWLVAVAVAVSLAAFGFYDFFVQHGVPIMRHDWAWPADDAELRAFYSLSAAPAWNVGGAGDASTYPAMYPLVWCMSALGTLFSTKAVLNMLLAGTFVTAFLGVYAIARLGSRPQIGRLGAMFASTVYASSPFFLNELIAGHLLNLVGYALLPILVVCAINVERRLRPEIFLASALLAGLLVGFSGIQIQYLAFDGLLLALLCVTSPSVGPVVLFSAIAVTIGALTQGFSLGNLLLPAAAAVDLPPRVPLEWFGDMSVQPRLELLGYGYAADYARATFAWEMTGTIWQVSGFAAIVPIAVALLVKRSVRWPLICLVGVFGASGILGPGGELKSWAFSHLLAAGLVRELYNFTCLTSLGFALCVGLTVDWIAQKTRSAFVALTRGTVGLVTLFAIGLLVYPFALRHTISFLHFWSPSGNYESLGSLLTDPSARVEFLPAALPLHNDKAKDGSIFSAAGNEMWGYVYRGHPVAFEYVPARLVGLGLSALGHEDYRFGARIFGMFGTRYFIVRHDVTSYAQRYWFPDLFPPTWEHGSALVEASAAGTSLVRLAANHEFDVYENKDYHPILSVSLTRLVCDRSVVFRAVFGDTKGCRRGTASTPAMKALPIPDDDTYSPFDGWVAAQPFFMVNESLAEHWQSIFTESSRPHLDRFHVSESLSLFGSCQGNLPATLVIDGLLRAALRCAPFASQTDSWQLIATLRPGFHSVVTEKAPGPMVLNPLIGLRVTAAKPTAVIDPAQVAVLSGRAKKGDPSDWVSFERKAPDVMTGTFRCKRACLLLQEETFSPHWLMRVDGTGEIASTPVNLAQNGFIVPSGLHKFTLVFDLPPVNQALHIIGNWSWLVVGLTALGLVVLGSMRSGRSHISLKASIGAQEVNRRAI